MVFLRMFVRGLSRTVMRSVARRTVNRLAGRSVDSGIRRMSDYEDTDQLTDDLADQVDILEVFELAAEAPFIIENARVAAAAGSQEVFTSQMGAYNRGQQSLAEQYCIPYAEEYWSTVEEPDPDAYLSGMYSQHEAIEQALSNSCEQSYEAGRSAGAAALYSDLSAYIAESLLAKGMNMAGIKNMKNDWGDFASAAIADEDAIQHAIRNGSVSDKVRFRYEGGDFEYMVISRSPSGPGSRQLSWGQFFGSDQPYWFTETRRMLMARIQGHMSTSDYNSKVRQLWAATYRDPWSTSPPPGYRPYSGQEWTYNG